MAWKLKDKTFCFRRYWEYEKILAPIFHPGPGSLAKGRSESENQREKETKEDKEAFMGHWTLVVVEPWRNRWSHFDSVISKVRYELERVEVIIKGWMRRQLEQRNN